MGEIQQAASIEISQAGAREFQEFNDQKRKQYRDELIRLRDQLNDQYKNSESDAARRDKVNQRFRNEIASELRKQLGEKFRIKESGKGGADLYFYDSDRARGLSSILDETKDIIQGQNLIERYKTIRKEVYALKENNDLQRISLEAMAKIYAIRQDIMKEEVEERIAITFAEGNIQKVLTLPMSQFLRAAQQNLSLTSMGNESLMEGSLGDINKITMNTGISTVIKKLRNLEGAKVSDLSYYNKKELNWQVISYNRNIKKTFTNDIEIEQLTYREDKSYAVVKSGFFREAIIEAMLNQTEDLLYEEDNAPWYGKADTSGYALLGRQSTKVDMSVKDFMGRTPTLLRINSLFNIINITLNVLQAQISTSAVEKFLYDNVFQATSDLDEKGVDTLLNKLLEKLA